MLNYKKIVDINNLIRNKFKFNYICWKYKLFSTNKLEITLMGVGRRNQSLLRNQKILSHNNSIMYLARRFSILTVEGSNDKIVSITLPDYNIEESEERFNIEDLMVTIDFSSRQEAKKFIMGLTYRLQTVADEASYLPATKANCMIVYNKLTNN